MKKHYYSFLIVTLLLSKVSFAQIPSWSWAWRMGGNNGDQIDYLEIDEQGNSYVCGNFKSAYVSFASSQYSANYSQPKSFFAKFSESGQLLWHKVYPANIQFCELIEGYNNTYYVLMSYYGTVNLGGFSFTNNSGVNRTLVVKYNAAGNVLSANNLLDNSVTGTVLIKIVKHPKGGFAFLGVSYQSTILNGIAVPANSNYIGYMDTIGSIQEIHLLGGLGAFDSTSFSFPDQVVYRDLKVSPLGNIYLAGEASINSHLTVDTATWQLPAINCPSANNCVVRTFIACFDSTFSFKWSHVGVLINNFSGLSSGANYGGIHVFPDESVILSQNVEGESDVIFDGVSCGPRATPTSYHDGVLAKIAGNGTVLWVKRFDSSDYASNFINAITGDALGNSYLFMYSGSYQNTNGSVYANAVISKVDANGSVQWYKGTDNGAVGGIYFYVLGLKEDGRGNIYMAGGFSSHLAPLPDFNGTVLQWHTPVFQYPYAFDAFISKLNNCSALPLQIIPDNNISLCIGDSLQLNATGGPMFLWSDLDSNAYKWISSADTLTLITYDSLGCYSKFDTIRVSTRPIFNSNQNLFLCAEDSVLVNNNYYTQSGIYHDVFVAINGCDSTVITTIFVDALQAQIQDVGMALQAVNVPIGCTFQWLDCNNSYSPLVGETNQSFSPLANGSYAVLIDNSNCQDTSACYDFVTVDVPGNTEDFPVLFYPNPVKDILTFSLQNSTSKIGNISLSNLNGEIVFISNSSIGQINMSQLASGIYVLSYHNYEGVFHHKLIKQ
jgi:hypothetical protein